MVNWMAAVVLLTVLLAEAPRRLRALHVEMETNEVQRLLDSRILHFSTGKEMMMAEEEKATFRSRQREEEAGQEEEEASLLILSEDKSPLRRQQVAGLSRARARELGGDIRCYCNLPVCVSTGYMCKSIQGTCFSEVVDHSDLSKTRHGCLELISSPSNECITHPNAKARVSPSLMCCNEDMCNYIDNLEIWIQVTKLNESYTGVSSGSSNNDGSFSQDAALRQDVWFKAATIAVPICGIFILILLVVLAVRMLRKDNKRHQKAMEVRRQHHYNKSHRLLQEQPHYQQVVAVDSKNAANAKINLNQNLQAEKQQNNVFRDVNVTIATEPVDKVDKSLNNAAPSSAYKTIVLWGKPEGTLL